MSDTDSDGSEGSSASTGWVNLSNSTKYDEVIFKDISASYPLENDIVISYELAENFLYDKGDYVAIFPAGFKFISSALVKKLVDPNVHMVTFEASCLPDGKDEFYQFSYVKPNGFVSGASIPFKVTTVPSSLTKKFTIETSEGDFLVVIKSQPSAEDLDTQIITSDLKEQDEKHSFFIEMEPDGATSISQKPIEENAHDEAEKSEYFESHQEQYEVQIKVLAEELSDLNEQKSLLTDKIAQHEIEKSELKASFEEKLKFSDVQNNVLAKEFSVLKKQNSGLTKKIAQHEIENSKLKENFKALQQVINQQDRKLQDDLKVIVSYRKRLQEVSYLNGLESTANPATSDFLKQALDEKNAELRAVEASKQLALTELTAEKEKYKELQSQRQHENDQMIKQLSEQHHKDIQQIEKLSVLHHVDVQEIEKLSLQHHVDVQEIEKLSLQHHVDVQEIEKLSLQHHEDILDIEKLSLQHHEDVQKIENLSAQHHEDIQEIEKLSEQLREDTCKIEQMWKQHDEDCQKLDKLSAECFMTRKNADEMELLKAKCKELEHKLEMADAEIVHLMWKCNELENSNNYKDLKISDLIKNFLELEGTAINKQLEMKDVGVDAENFCCRKCEVVTEDLKSRLLEAAKIFKDQYRKIAKLKKMAKNCDMMKHEHDYSKPQVEVNKMLKEIDSPAMEKNRYDSSGEETTQPPINASFPGLLNDSDTGEPVLKTPQQTTKLAPQQTTELTQQQAAKLASQQTKELTQQQAAKLASQQTIELTQQQAAKLASQQTTELTQQLAAKLASQQTTELTQQQAAKLASRQTIELTQPQAAKLAQLVLKNFKKKRLNEAKECIDEKSIEFAEDNKSVTCEKTMNDCEAKTCEDRKNDAFPDGMKNVTCEKNMNIDETETCVDEKNDFSENVKDLTWNPHVYCPSFQAAPSNVTEQEKPSYNKYWESVLYHVASRNRPMNNWKKNKNWVPPVVISEESYQLKPQYMAPAPFARRNSSVPILRLSGKSVQNGPQKVWDQKDMKEVFHAPVTSRGWAKQHEGLQYMANASTNEYYWQRQGLRPANALAGESTSLQEQSQFPVNGHTSQPKESPIVTNACTGWWPEQQEDLRFNRMSAPQIPSTLSEECQKPPMNKKTIWEPFVAPEVKYTESACPTCQQEIFTLGNDLSPMMDHLEFAHQQTLCPICHKVFNSSLSGTKHFKYHVESHFN